MNKYYKDLVENRVHHMNAPTSVNHFSSVALRFISMK